MANATSHRQAVLRGWNGIVKAVTLTTVAASSGESGVVDIEGARAIGVHMSTAWTAAAITFLAAPTSTGIFHPVYGSTGEVELTVAANRYIGLTERQAEIVRAARFIKLRSGTDSTGAVVQAATRSINLILKG
jgi:hypothetical protein